MKKVLLFAILILFGSLSWAVLSDYAFQQSTATYAEVTTPVSIHAANIDDAMSAVIDIGFNFLYDDVVYTQFKANTNGFITLNASSTTSYGNNLTGNTLIIGALWDDLMTGTDGSVSYELSGTSPNQVLTVQYKNMNWYYSTTNLINFQIKLYQGINKIEYIYGAMADAPGTSASASIGLSGAANGNYLSVTPATPNATVSSTLEFAAINGTHVPFLTGNKYTFTPQPPPVNDLAATALIGNVTPSSGTVTNYTVSIYNRGSNAQSTYTVQLINAANTVLASVAGPTIAAGATAQVQVAWTPTTEGPVALRGKVVLTGDEYAGNDHTPVLNVTVMPAGMIVATIGDGSQDLRMPVDFFFRNSLNETLYFPAEIGAFGNISAIQIYNQFTQDLLNMPIKIWLGITDVADLSAGWIPSTQLTQVFDGTVNFPTGTNTIIIPLQTVFSYTGGNLVIMCNRPMDTQYYSSANVFKGQTVGTNRALNIYSDGTTYDPANPPTGATLTGQFAKTTLFMTPLSPNPLFSITPASKNFGSVLMNTTHNQTFTVLNAGGGTLTVSSISIEGSPYFTLQNMPTLPANLSTGQSITFVGRYNPTAAGTHTATISITDSRMVHTVALSGTSVDVNIYTLPYTQNFDTVTAPALPLDWSGLLSPNGVGSYVQTVASSPYSAPNCVSLYNQSSTTNQVLLIAPPLAPAIPLNTVRLKLMVRGSGTLSIGSVTNPLDSATYAELTSVTATGTWTEVAVQYNSYTGAANYIAIKHGNASAYQNIYVDNAIIELIAPNDLGCSALVGNTTPSMGSEATYTATVFNWGTNAQSTYSVKLFSAAGVELATAPGVTCAPGVAVQVPVAWTPAAEGPVTIYAKVVLTGDPNPANDQSPNLSLTVMPAGLMVVTVGDGSQTLRMPLDFFYRNSLNETLYYPTEMGAFGNITAIALYNQFVTTTLTSMPTKVWLGTTQLNDLSAGWIPSTQLTLVFDGTIAYPAGTNTIMIPLQNIFTYTGGNLVVLCNRPMDTTYYSSSDVFKGQTVGTNRALNVYSDSTVYDPANPPAAPTPTGQFAKTTFYMTAIGPDPIFLVNPASKDFGTSLINTTQNQTFTVMNVGGGTLTLSNIGITGSPFYSLQNLPNLPVSLTTGQTASFVGRYNPTAVGAHTATIAVTDNRGVRTELALGRSNDRNRLPHTIALSGNCIDTTVNSLPYAQNFDGATAPNLPVDWTSLISPTGGSASVQTNTTSPYSAPNCIRIVNGSSTTTSVSLIAPPLNVAIPTNTVRIKFWGKGGTAATTLQVGVMTDPLNAATFTEVQTITTPTAWTEFAVGFNGYTGTGRYIALKHGNTAASQTVYVDNVSLEVIAANDLGATVVTGPNTPTAGTQYTYNVGVFNWGTVTQTNYTVKLFDSSNVELATATGLSVAPGVTVQVPVLWTPQTAGAISIYGKVFLTGDPNPGNDQSPVLNLLVNPTGVWNVTVGDGSQQALIPVNMYWRNSLFETLYYPAEMDGFLGQILGVQFFNNFVTDMPNGATKIWLGTTTQADLSAGWIPSTELTLVFDGVVPYPSGANTITIPFATPYMYLNGENIVMMVNRPMDTTYYSSQDYFQAQTEGASRARTVYSDSTLYDPAAPPDGSTVSGQFPKTSFIVIPGGVGHVSGTVLGSGSQPLAGVSVQILESTYATTTNAQGQFMIQNVLPDDYTIQFSTYGYITATQTFNLVEDETEIINITLQPMPTVNVTGVVLASDTAAGINGAAIHLVGYADYTASTTATGAFTIPAVYANNAYAYTIMAPGYTAAMGTINVAGGNHNMGNITLNEVAFAPHSVAAVENAQGNAVTLTWQAPDPNAIEVTESFENEGFPPENWTQIITNTEGPNTSGVYPTWCRIGAITISGQPVTPTEGSYQGGLWWAYTHQDEWLITPSFNCPSAGYLNFDSYVFLGSTNGDHYYVKVSLDNGSTWTELWDASAQTGGWNYYATPINVDLGVYSGQQIKLAFNASDGPNDDGLWYVWFIDNIYIGNAMRHLGSPEDMVRFDISDLEHKSATQGSGWNCMTPTTQISRHRENGGIRTEPSLPFPQDVRHRSVQDRTLTGYKVWRLSAGQEANESAWSLLTPEIISNLTHTDTAWQTLPNGDYRWAVKGTYTNGVTSVPSFSNILNKFQQTGMIAGVVRRANTVPIPGATVSTGSFTATTNSVGAYTLILPTGAHDVTCSAAGFNPQTANGIVVSANQTTTLNFIMTVGVEDEVVPVAETALIGNYPNPFNPETTISYAVKDACPVRLEIYNAKGQKVRTLVNEKQVSGWYNPVWNGKDDNGRPVSSGVYMYRFTAGSFTNTRRMILMQ